MFAFINKTHRSTYPKPVNFENLHPGCRVLMKPMSWYKENLDKKLGCIKFENNDHGFVDTMSQYLGTWQTVREVFPISTGGSYFQIVEDDEGWAFTIDSVESIES